MNRRLSQLVLALLLFTQFAVVAQACESLVASPVGAFLQEESCHDSGLSNACLAHCLDDDRTLDTHQTVIVAPSTHFILVELPRIPAPAVRFLIPARSGDPPPSIRFCSFQI
jgi:hypothetical protein